MTEKSRKKAKKAFTWGEHGAAMFGLVSLFCPGAAEYVHQALGLANAISTVINQGGIQP